MGFVIKWIFKTVIGRWVTGISVTLLLSGGAWKWYDFKSDLVEEGTQVCVQEINKETMQQLQDALAAEKSARAELTARLIAVALVNREAVDRRVEAEVNLRTIEAEMRTQRENDETYREWSDTALPDGVAGRLRGEATTGDPGPIRDSSN